MRNVIGALAVVVVVATGVGCGEDTPQTPSVATPMETAALATAPNHTLPALPNGAEYAFFNGKTRIVVFPGINSPKAETFFIWNLGTSIQHTAPYPSADHGRFYGVFAPGPAGSTHHVDGQDMWDHYHVISEGIGIRTFDVYLVFPGPNFNPATFKGPLSEADLNTQVTAGILAAPILTTQAGFDQLVLKIPVL